MDISESAFFKVCGEFKLGRLTTESSNLKTGNLSWLAKNDPASAIRVLQEVDYDAFSLLEKRLEDIYLLKQAVKKTLEDGHKIYISGCGATGRLALALETFWRFGGGGGQVRGFMAGGDYALIKSVERFEDRMSYGRRQLEEMGFEDGDLLLAVTEGGETSFVIGSALHAAKTSQNPPFFLYCNPDGELEDIQRSKEVLNNPAIRKLNLNVGPMAITGSTRMQATTAQMLALALALFSESGQRKDFLAEARAVLRALRNLSYRALEPFVVKEADIYLKGGSVTYACASESAITLLTDTTERSPTFSLAPFEKESEDRRSLAYLALYGRQNSASAWEALLGRKPRGLEWAELDIKIDREEIYKFDISAKALKRRGGEVFSIESSSSSFIMRLAGLEGEIPKSGVGDVYDQIGLKMALNILSTLIMGRLGRYEGNLMTYVRPSNFKLVDRAARYVVELGRRGGKEIGYESAAKEIFNQIPALGDDEPVVLKALEAFVSG